MIDQRLQRGSFSEETQQVCKAVPGASSDSVLGHGRYGGASWLPWQEVRRVDTSPCLNMNEPAIRVDVNSLPVLYCHRCGIRALVYWRSLNLQAL
jgi:hypothetical protein